VLSDATKSLKTVTILSWIGTYELRQDGNALLEASSKKFLEDLLVVVRNSLEHRRTASTSSVSSVSSTAGSVPPLESSTPARGRSQSIVDDMRYKKERLTLRIINLCTIF